jgi:3-oxoacyl-[acyl-carrier protein] reductase
MRNKVVVVTGGAAGIGRATAVRFAEAGAKVVICDVNQEAGEAVARSLGHEAAFYKLNVANRAEVGAFVDQVAARYGRIDVLVNNAGITRDAQFLKMQDGNILKQMAEADFDLVISINLKGVFNCTQAVVPHMIKQGGGVILNASSAVALYGNFGQTNYVATKAGVIGMTKVWARELGRSNIRVNAVAPGFTATEMVMKMPEKVREGMKARTPLGCLAEPSDIANAYYFLASDQARHITGTVLSVDGGLVIGT